MTHQAKIAGLDQIQHGDTTRRVALCESAEAGEGGFGSGCHLAPVGLSLGKTQIDQARWHPAIPMPKFRQRLPLQTAFRLPNMSLIFSLFLDLCVESYKV